MKAQDFRNVGTIFGIAIVLITAGTAWFLNWLAGILMIVAWLALICWACFDVAKDEEKKERARNPTSNTTEEPQ